MRGTTPCARMSRLQEHEVHEANIAKAKTAPCLQVACLCLFHVSFVRSCPFEINQLLYQTTCVCTHCFIGSLPIGHSQKSRLPVPLEFSRVPPPPTKSRLPSPPPRRKQEHNNQHKHRGSPARPSPSPPKTKQKEQTKSKSMGEVHNNQTKTKTTKTSMGEVPLDPPPPNKSRGEVSKMCPRPSKVRSPAATRRRPAGWMRNPWGVGRGGSLSPRSWDFSHLIGSL